MSKKTILELLKNAAYQLLRHYFKWFLMIFVSIYFLSGFYNIERDSAGVLMRFGKIIPFTIEPGLHYKIPWPVDRVTIIPVKKIKTLIVDDFSLSKNSKGDKKGERFYKSTGVAPYFITGDNNILSMKMTLKYTISNPVKYLLNNRSPEVLLEESVAESIVKHALRTPVDEILTVGRKNLEMVVKRDLSSKLERYGSGLSLVFIEIQEVKPPSEVQSDFDKVINANVEKKQTINEAQIYYNRTLSNARTKADVTIQAARSYKNSMILQAKGRSNAFLAKLVEMKSSREILRKKIYTDFLKRFFPNLTDVRVVNKKDSQQQTFIF